MEKNVVFKAKGCLRTAFKHPFLVCTLCVLMFMPRLSPVLFSLLVSSSPIFVCTAVLLGALLTLAQPNNAVVNLRSKQATALEKSNAGGEIARDYPVERKWDETMHGDIRGAVSSLIENQGIEIQKVEIREFDRELKKNKKKKKKKTKMKKKKKAMNRNEEESDSSALSQKFSENLESDYEKSDADFFDSERVNVDSPPESPWAKLQSRIGDESDVSDDYTLDLGSDSASSSPEIIPMLDELHPLLDEDGTLPVQMMFQGSRAMSEMSHLSTTSGNESDAETDDIGFDEDDTMDEKDEQVKPVIVWTEEDQKNLQDLGTSEIERNKRLESLMQRRKERKYKSMLPNENLMNLELKTSRGASPFNLARISTTRQNPFEVANDGYDNSELPPIPGSAPSILQPRRNPFDIPCHSRKEKSDSISSRFRDDFTLIQPRGTMFSRRRHDNHDVKMRPYFVPESPYLQQSNEMSDSRLSSVPETTSVSSVDDTDDQRLADEDVSENCPSGESLVPDVTSEHVSQTSEEETVVGASKNSSPSSMSETSKRAFNETDREEGSKDDVVDDRDTSTRTSVRSTVASSPANEAVYDSSPPSLKKNLSCYYSFNEQSDLDFLPQLLKQTASLVEGNPDGDSREIDKTVSISVKHPEYSDEEKQHQTTNSGRERLSRVRVSSSERRVEASQDSIDREASDKSPSTDDEVYQEANVNISTPLARETSNILYRRMKKGPISEQLAEDQVPNTPVDFNKLKAIPILNIPKVRELIDSAVHIDSPYTPDIPSLPSSASKQSGPHFNMQTILEEIGEAKETNEMSESDNEGQVYWQTRPTAFDHYVDAGEESSSRAEKLDGDLRHVKGNHSNDGSEMATRASKEEGLSEKHETDEVGSLEDKTNDNGKAKPETGEVGSLEDKTNDNGKATVDSSSSLKSNDGSN